MVTLSGGERNGERETKAVWLKPSCRNGLVMDAAAQRICHLIDDKGVFAWKGLVCHLLDDKRLWPGGAGVAAVGAVWGG